MIVTNLPPSSIMLPGDPPVARFNIFLSSSFWYKSTERQLQEKQKRFNIFRCDSVCWGSLESLEGALTPTVVGSLASDVFHSNESLVIWYDLVHGLKNS
jgi:hypothetical protein